MKEKPSLALLIILALVVGYILEYFIFFINGATSSVGQSIFQSSFLFVLAPALAFAYIRVRNIDRMITISFIAFAGAGALSLIYSVATAGKGTFYGNEAFILSLILGITIVISALITVRLGIFSNPAFEVEIGENVNIVFRTWGTGIHKGSYSERKLPGVVIGFRETLIRIRYETLEGESLEDWFDPWQVKRLGEDADE
jgi:hypothetical protein